MIKLSEDFSVFPGGRTYEDGKFSAREFYDKFLNDNESHIIDLDGTRGFASCFLDELVKLIGPERIGKDIQFVSERKSILDEIMTYKEKHMDKLETVLKELKSLTDEEKRALAEDKRFDELIKKIDEELEKIKRN